MSQNGLPDQVDLDGAQAAYRQAIGTGHPDQSPKAAVNLGLLRERQGDTDGAKAAYQRALDFADPETAPMAVQLLTDLEQSQDPVFPDA
jgi:Tfp pilus assembly protein PilF